jgi:predicted RNA methylase
MTELYSLSGYGSMIADHVRIEAYTEALRRNVRQGSVVLDIGTGPGIFAVLACQLGASRVYALELDNIIQVARDLAAANGCADRIEFIQDISTRVTLPERADVMISDLRGVLPFFQRHIPSITDARRRLLAPGGILIPRRDTVWVAVVEAPLHYGSVVDVWEHNLLDQNLRPARELAVNNIQKMRLKAEQLMTRPQLWATLDYATIADTDAQGELQWAVDRAGIGHGIVVWFDAELADGVGFSCSIDTPDGIYGSLFFPWRQPSPCWRARSSA